MATRIHCDHCGNTVRPGNYEVFTFGPKIAFDMQLHQAMGHMQALQMGQQNVANVGAPRQPIETVDLCTICIPIWATRVRNLTKASDPD